MSEILTREQQLEKALRGLDNCTGLERNCPACPYYTGHPGHGGQYDPCVIDMDADVRRLLGLGGEGE